MYKEVLQSISGVEIFPIISLVLFVVAFLGVTLWTIRLNKAQVKQWSSLPLDDNITNDDDAEGRN
jgi:hypothetical protein